MFRSVDEAKLLTSKPLAIRIDICMSCIPHPTKFCTSRLPYTGSGQNVQVQDVRDDDVSLTEKDLSINYVNKQELRMNDASYLIALLGIKCSKSKIFIYEMSV